MIIVSISLNLWFFFFLRLIFYFMLLKKSKIFCEWGRRDYQPNLFWRPAKPLYNTIFGLIKYLFIYLFIFTWSKNYFFGSIPPKIDQIQTVGLDWWRIRYMYVSGPSYAWILGSSRILKYLLSSTYAGCFRVEVRDSS